MDFTIQDLRSLGQCPAQYFLRKQLKIEERDSHEDALLRGARACLLWYQHGGLSEARVKEIWSNTVAPMAQFDFPTQSAKERAWIIKGLESLLWFRDELINLTAGGTVRTVFERFTIPVGKVSFSGVIDMVVDTPKGPELLVLESIVAYHSSQWEMDRDASIQAAAWAFRTLYKETERRVWWANLPRQFIGRVYVREQGLKLLRERLERARRLVEASAFFPVMNRTCASCPVKKPCEKGEWLYDPVYRQGLKEDALRRGRRGEYRGDDPAWERARRYGRAHFQTS